MKSSGLTSSCYTSTTSLYGFQSLISPQIPGILTTATLPCYAHELPFSVKNAGQPTSFSIEALYTPIGGIPYKNFH
jgi:hypothetical protein